MACSAADSPVMAQKCNNSTPIKRMPICSPVRNVRSANFGEKQRTPLSQIHRFVHSGVHLLANTPGKNHSVHTPEYGSGNQLMKDGRTHFLTPLSVNSNIQNRVHCCNPFETALIDSLHQSIFSPNVFKTSTPGRAVASPKFQWSIDELAMLKPVDIELPHPGSWFSGHNSELEERAQKAIDTFFSSNVIVPSPWTNSSERKSFKLPQTPGRNGDSDSPMIFCSKVPVAAAASSCHSSAKSIVYIPCNKLAVTSKEVEVQTVITIPKDFDLESLLGAQCRYNDAVKPASRPKSLLTSAALKSTPSVAVDEVCSTDILSNSSLRRKLFFHGDEGTPISPVRSIKCRTKCNTLEAEVPLSPSILCEAGAQKCAHDVSAAASNDSVLSDLFSSSPIRTSNRSPSFRRCSTAPQLIDSPPISPISHCYYSSHADELDELQTLHSPVSRRDTHGSTVDMSVSRRVSLSCRRSAGPSLNQLRVCDNIVDVDEDSNCCSMMDMSAATQQHVTVAVSQTDTGYQSNIMQTTGVNDGALSITTATAGLHCIPPQHSTVDNIDNLNQTDDL